jgi:hypothetical protein
MVVGIKGAATPFGTIPRYQGALARHEQFFELEDLIELCQHIESNPKSPIVLEFERRPRDPKSGPTQIFLVTEFCFRVKRVLADIGSPSASAALRWFSLIKFTESKNGVLSVSSRAEQDTLEDRQTSAHLFGKVGRRLAQVRDIHFYGERPNVDRAIRPANGPKKRHHKETDARAKAKTGIGNISTTDQDRYDRLTEDEIRTHANCVLWRQHKNREKQHMSRPTYHAFRESVNRIRKCLELPSSASLLKMK